VKRAVIYTRVSTEEQTKGHSLENQKQKCIDKAKELGCEDWIIFEEAGVSGEIATRPALMDAIELTQRDRSIKYFICTDPDRLSRKLSNLLVLTEQIEKRAELVFIDFDRQENEEGELFYAIRGSIAQFEKALIRRRTMNGKLKAASEGKWTHWPDIYGYDFVDGQVVVNESEAKIVRLIFQYGAQMGVKNICDRLAMMGIPSPRARKTVWSGTTVRRILNNESYYTGKTYIRKYSTAGTHLNKYIENPEDKYERTLRPKEEWIEMHIPPIITEEEFKAAARRQANARRRFDGKPKHKYLLSGLIRCGLCGSTWHGVTTKHKYYVCTLRSPGPRAGSGLDKCKAGFVHCEDIDNAVWKVVRSWIESDEAVRKFNEQQISQMESTRSTEIDVLRQRELELSQEEDNLIERIARETSPRLRQKLNDRLDSISRELDHVKAQLDELTASEPETAATVNFDVIKSIRSRIPNLDSLTFDEQYNIIHETVKEVKVTVRENGPSEIRIIPLN
jgi:site-specific DNA recombinase